MGYIYSDKFYVNFLMVYSKLRLKFVMKMVERTCPQSVKLKNCHFKFFLFYIFVKLARCSDIRILISYLKVNLKCIIVIN